MLHFFFFQKKGYDNVSLNGIAREAGFAKSNIYRYYSSKEEIFLNIYSELLVKWSEDCLNSFRKLDENPQPSIFAESLIQSLLRHQERLDLMPYLMISLEKNTSIEQLRKFKRLVKELMTHFVFEVSRIYPNARKDKIPSFLVTLNASILYQWSSYTGNVILDQLYEEEEFFGLKPDFKKSIEVSTQILIDGINKT